MSDNKPPDPWIPLADWNRAAADGTTEEHALLIAFDGSTKFSHLPYVLLTKNPDGTITVSDPAAATLCKTSEEWSKTVLRMAALPAPRRKPAFLPDPWNWDRDIKAWKQTYARRARRRRIRSAVQLFIALAVAALISIPLIESIATAYWWPAVPFWGAVTAAGCVWVVEEYRAFRRALRGRT